MLACRSIGQQHEQVFPACNDVKPPLVDLRQDGRLYNQNVTQAEDVGDDIRRFCCSDFNSEPFSLGLLQVIYSQSITS